MCPPRAAEAGAHSQATQSMLTRPGPHRCLSLDSSGIDGSLTWPIVVFKHAIEDVVSALTLRSPVPGSGLKLVAGVTKSQARM